MITKKDNGRGGGVDAREELGIVELHGTLVRGGSIQGLLALAEGTTAVDVGREALGKARVAPHKALQVAGAALV